MKKIISIICCMLALVLSLTACSQSEPAPAAVVTETAALADGGTILLSVNPEIAVDYDNDGFVTGISARNDDAFKVLANYAGFNGKQAHTVVSELVSVIGEAGYFVEEVEGEPRQIVLEIEPGSAIPGAHFVDYVVKEVQKTIDENSWQTPLNLEGISDYGITDYSANDYSSITDYNDTDYGPNNDGVTDYDHNINNDTDYGPSSDGITDYDGTDYFNNTDYGINADGNTDYNDSDYGIWGDGITDYIGNDGITDYDGTDYNVNNNGSTDYNYSDYGNSNYNNGNSGYQAPIPPAFSGNSNYGNSVYCDSAYEAPAPSYGGGNSGYSDYGGGGYSDYSGYGES